MGSGAQEAFSFIRGGGVRLHVQRPCVPALYTWTPGLTQ